MQETELKSILAHFPDKQSQAFTDYVANVAFLHSRYIFTWNVGRKQFGYCTHCRIEFETEKLRHRDIVTCGFCGSKCGVRSSGRGRKYMVDERYIVWYERSLVNPKAITAHGVYAVRDYRGDFRGVETNIQSKVLYLFEPGQSTMLIRPYMYYSKSLSDWQSSSWSSTESIFSFLTYGSMANIPFYCSKESIEAAIQETPFQYSTWEKYYGRDMVKFFDLYSKYPCIEYLTKLGMSEIVEAKLMGEKTYGVINWRANNPVKVLKMSKQELNELRASRIRVDPWFLFLFQLAKKDGSKMALGELAAIRNQIDPQRQNDLLKALSRTTLRKLNAYFNKQLDKKEVCDYYRTRGQLLTGWNDYIKDCLKLGMDISQEAIFFPSNLHRAHQNTIKQIKVKEDEALREQIAIRRKALEKMRFEALGFLLRPAMDQKELIEEGKALQHCVGTYAKQYARGDTDLFVIRKVNDPETPFYTMEVKNGSIAQCRGLKNCLPNEKVQAFVDAFTAAKLAKKQKKIKQQVELEVAV